jgi:hypothetical protein
MKKVYMRSCVWLLVLLLMVPVGGFAQETGSAPPVFRQEELDQMLAPIALYPDSLLIQMLMASTYPLEVVQAERWLNSNPNLKDEKLAAALDQKDWDPSVKSMVNFPSVLAMMNDKLEWTQNLGDAFLGQRDQVMATVQDLRAKAHARGNLKTTREQVVVAQDRSIVIEPANPQVIYVPAYNPTVVFGPWWYPAYPPYYYFPPGFAALTTGIISFGVALTVGVAWSYAWGNFNWAHRNVYINPAQNIAFNRFYPPNGPPRHPNGPPHPNGPGEWRHDPIHRKGVAYKDPGVRQQFGQTGNPGANARKDFRGFDQGGQNRAGKPAGQGAMGQGQQPSGQKMGTPGQGAMGQGQQPSGQKMGTPGQGAMGQGQQPSGQKMGASGQGAMGQGQQPSGQKMGTPGQGAMGQGQQPSGQKMGTPGQGAMGQGQQPSGQKMGASGLNAGGNQQFKAKGTDSVQHRSSMTPQNRSSSAIENFNRGGSEVKQQSDRGRSSRDSLPTQKSNQLLQGGKVNQGGGNPTGSGGRGDGGANRRKIDGNHHQ